MKRIVVFILVCFSAMIFFTACSAGKKNYTELKGLMLLENEQLGRNKAFYSKHNKKVKKEAFKKYRKNNRALNARRS